MGPECCPCPSERTKRVEESGDWRQRNFDRSGGILLMILRFFDSPALAGSLEMTGTCLL